MISNNPKPRLIALRNLAFAIVVLWFAPMIAAMAANGLSRGAWVRPVFFAVVLFIYLAVFGGMGTVLDGQEHPYQAMGLARRTGWGEELALGAAVGWGLVVAVTVVIALFGGLRIGFDGSVASWVSLGINLLTLALASLVEEVAFRGYPFQRLIDATGPVIAVVIASVAFGARHAANPNATPRSVAVTMLAGLLFSLAYLRTRALWVGWGMHFAWNFALAVIFGLPMSGFRDFSSLVQARAREPLWLTGGSYGPEASLTAAVVLFGGIWVVVRVTRDYAWRYTHPEIISRGIPVDIGGHPVTASYPPPAAVAPAKPTEENGLIQIQLK